jgi:exosortase A-associated hydrolase 2
MATMKGHGPQAFFLDAGNGTGHRFCLFHPGRTPKAKGRMLYVHPFAEEMNKSRRMAALQSRALSEAGYDVLQIDLLGCGDSSGDFADATWQAWIDDVLLGCRWLESRGDAPLWLWGLRAGCLVASAAAQRLGTRTNFLMWHPSVNGRQVLQQVLRIKLATGGRDGTRHTMDELRGRLQDGRSVEVAGYVLSPLLARGLDAAALMPPDRAMRLEWFEFSTRADDESLVPASAQCVSSWQAAGAETNAKVVRGPSFWQTVEVEEAPLLIEATVAALSERTLA